MVVRLLSRFLLFAALTFVATAFLLADTFKLYLKEGGFHLVREYQVGEDRVRYYSTERGDWEEIPKDLVDLNKTESERKATKEQVSRTTHEQDEEDKAERAYAREIASIPVETGGYYKPGKELKTLKLADYQINTSKRRRVVQLVSPIPLVPGKATVVIKGEHSAFEVSEKRPEFFLRLAKEEKFGIIKLTPHKAMRVVEDVSVVPVSHENVENRKQMNTFEQELSRDLYKVWPEQPLEPGEYALMEYSDSFDQQEIQLLIWDFAVR